MIKYAIVENGSNIVSLIDNLEQFQTFIKSKNKRVLYSVNLTTDIHDEISGECILFHNNRKATQLFKMENEIKKIAKWEAVTFDINKEQIANKINKNNYTSYFPILRNIDSQIINIVGPNRCGKTHLICKIINEISQTENNINRPYIKNVVVISPTLNNRSVYNAVFPSANIFSKIEKNKIINTIDKIEDIRCVIFDEWNYSQKLSVYKEIVEHALNKKAIVITSFTHLFAELMNYYKKKENIDTFLFYDHYFENKLKIWNNLIDQRQFDDYHSFERLFLKNTRERNPIVLHLDSIYKFV